jgi:putative hemolysin
LKPIEQSHNESGAKSFSNLVGDRILARGEARQKYTVSLAASSAEIEAAQRLRFNVFNLELKEGLPQSFATGLDADPFDAVCDHLIVKELPSGNIVGTYRLQTGAKAREKLGYYSAQEFDLTPLEPFRNEIVELGRACVDIQHRNLAVLGYLWRGIAEYAKSHNSHYLVGCSSLTSQIPAEGAAAYAVLSRRYLAAEPYRVKPLPLVACPMDQPAVKAPKIPKLLTAYLSMGAKICGLPAIDREFKTIDFLTLHDLDTLPAQTVKRFFS